MKFIVTGLLVVACTAVAGGQQRGVPLTLLQQADSSVRGREVISAVAEFAPASDTGWHTHPGEMIGYIVAGSVVLRQSSKPPQTVQTGESFIIPAGVIHTCSNDSQTAARMSVTYVVEKGKPIRTNVTRP